MSVICQYVKKDCQEFLKVFISSLNYKYEKSITGMSLGCGFDKLLYLGTDQIVATFFESYTLYFKTFKYSNDHLAEEIGQTKIISNCVVDTLKIDTSVFSNTNIIGVCIDYNNYNAKVALVDLNKAPNVKVFTSSCQPADFTFASKFGDNFLSIFYKCKSNNVFEIFEEPLCIGFEISLFINQESSSFSMNKGEYLFVGNGANDASLNVIYPELPLEGKVYFTSNNTEIEQNKVYKISELKHISGSNAGIYNLKFAVGKWCHLKFIVNPCYQGCYTCTELGPVMRINVMDVYLIIILFTVR